MSSRSTTDCFALLDDADASAIAPRSRLYTGYLGTETCSEVTALPAFLMQLQQPGRYAVALFDYELGGALQQIAPRDNAAPLARALLFADCQQLSADEVSHWLQERGDGAAAGIADLRADVDDVAFDRAIAQIRDFIAAGDTYQVNYTYRLHFEAFGNLFTLHQRLRERQPVPYGALIGLPDGAAILSLSPELFIQHQDGILTARPMKGTAPAFGHPQQDAANATRLAADPKNRAENLMIIDLLRNDLSRVARVGSVAVPQLFEVSRFADVLQMTSTVTAELRDDATLTEVIEALYPCGSITGAPKRRTMQLIRQIETSPRGMYTGAIGWFDPPASRRIGDFCLSVPIRTLVLQPPGPGQLRRGEMGIGAGIVYDSVAADERAECRLKAQFLTQMPNLFSLFETMAISRDGGCPLLERHLRRLGSSAAYFQFRFDRDKVQQAVLDTCAALPDAAPYRLRLALDANGECIRQIAPLTPLTGPVRLLMASSSTRADDLFLRHKTTLRAQYDQAWRAAEAQGAFDMLFCNEHGEVTEGGRCTLFAQIDGSWFTPPLAAGVLPGVMRAHLLEDAAWAASERTLSLDDVRSAQRLVVCNALRGTLPAILEPH